MAARQITLVRPETHGPVPAGMSELVTTRVASLLRIAEGHIEAVRIILTVTVNPTVRQPATARVMVVLDGHILLVQAAGPSLHAAIEHMAGRLRMRLLRLALGWQARRGNGQSL